MIAAAADLKTLAGWIATLRVSAELHRAAEERSVQEHGDAVDHVADELERLYAEAVRGS